MSIVITFRKATESDIPFLLELRSTTMNPHIQSAGLPIGDTSHLERIHYRFDCAIIIELELRRIGLFKVVKEGSLWDLVQIQFLPEFQGRGFGKKIISELIDEAQHHNASVKLSVFKKNPAKKLYDSLGFITIEETEASYEMQTTA